MNTLPAQTVVNQPAIDRWEKRGEHLREQLAKAERHLASLPKPAVTPNDPAFVNLKGHLRNLDRDIDKGVALTKAESYVESFTARLRGHQLRKPTPLTLDDIKAATAILTDIGGFTVAKVNKTTVSVHTGHSWTDRVPFGSILAVAS